MARQLSDSLAVAREQLRRMRGMTAAYHRQFFSDVRFTLGIGIALFVATFAGVDRAVLLVPFVMLWGACQTAFDASYLHFARHYAAALETRINKLLGEELLVAGHIEDSYLYPLTVTKLVTIAVPGPVTWFGFMTGFITVGGVLATGAAFWMAKDVASGGAFAAVAAGYATLAVPALVIGLWWFLGGAGERRIQAVLREAGLAEG